MRPLAPLPLAAGLAALLAGSSVVLAAPKAKAMCIGGNSICNTFLPDTDSTIIGHQITGTITASPATNSRLKSIAVQFTLNPGSGSFNFPVTLKDVKLTSAPNGMSGANVSTGDFNFGDITLSTFNDSGNTLPPAPFQTLSSEITTNINFLNAGTKLSFTIPAGLVNNGGQISANIVYGRSGSGFPATSDVFTTTAGVPGPLPILGAASAFGFSRSLRRRIKVAKAV